MILGLDSSTQSFSAVIIDADAGKIVGEWSVNFGQDLPQYDQPNGYDDQGGGVVHSNPLMWLDALDLLCERMVAGGAPLSEITAVSGSGQQHGSVYLKRGFSERLKSLSPDQSISSQLKDCLSRDSSPIWMDSSTATQCHEIASAVGGDAVVREKSGSVAIERFTGSQIRKFSQEEPEAYQETGVIHLVSSFLCSVLSGRSADIDHGDGAGMNLMNLADGDWDPELLHATAPGLATKLPPCQPSSATIAEISPYFVEKYGFNPECESVLWSGDNPCSLVGIGAARPGQVVISLGTSDTLFAAMPTARTDPDGFGHAFGNPMGGFMSLICFKNGSLAREAVKDKHGLDWDQFGLAGLAKTEPGNDGILMLPFFEPEITPRLDTNGPVYSVDRDLTAAEETRAVLEGQFLNMKIHSAWLQVPFDTISLTGGASKNDGIAQVVADVFGCPVNRLEVPGSAALGAAMRAAVAVHGADLETLEQQFCAPEEGSTVEPNQQATARYQEALKNYQELLERANTN